MQEVRIWSVESYLYCDTDISDEQSYRACVTLVTTLWNNAGTKPYFKKSNAGMYILYMKCGET